MAGLSTFLEEALLNYIRGTTPTAPATVYLSLHTADPTDAGTTAELVGNGYARQAIAFGAPSGTPRTITQGAQVDFPVNTGSNWGTVTHFGVWSASTAGNMLASAALTASKTVAVTDQLVFDAGSLTIQAT